MPKLLIVDDERSIRVTLAEFLRREGYEVESAEDTETAMALLEHGSFDAVVTDIILPGLCGLELLRRIRETAPDVPVIVMTGEPSVETAAEAVRAGALDYISKPIGKQAVVRAVKHALDVRLLADTRRRLEDMNRRQQRELERQVEERTRSLEESRRFLSDLVENSGSVIYAKGRDGRFELVNRQWEEVTGVPRETACGRTAEEVLPPEVARQCVDGDSRVIEGAAGCEFELVYPTPAGRRTFLVNKFPIRTPDGAVRAVCGILTEVTDRRRMEAALEEGLIQLRRSLEGAHIGSWSVDFRSGVLLWSEETYRIFGVPAGQPMTRSEFARLVDPRDIAALEKAWSDGQRTGQYAVEHRIVVGSAVKWVRERAEVMYDPAGQPVGATGTVLDVTEKKSVEAQFLRAQRVECLGALAGGIAHDLNNLLTPILFGASTLRSSVPDAGSQETVDLIERCARRGAEVIRHLLAFSRGSQGQRCPVQLRHLLREMAEIAGRTFPKSIAIRSDAARDLWMVLGEPTELHQVLMNLCVNARDAMPEGGTLSLVAANASIEPGTPGLPAQVAPGPFVRIVVSDTGCGMDPEVVERIFEPFFTTREASGGTGLGLSTVLGIVRSHGGFVNVQSRPGEGSRFEVYLPAASGPPPVVETAASRGAIRRGAGEGMLLVDDDSAIRETLGVLFERSGYAVRTAPDGARAMEILAASGHGIRVLVTDLAMPAPDGFALVRWTRTHCPSVAVVVVTGMTNLDELAARLEVLGVDRPVRKPGDPLELLAAVRRALDAGKSPKNAGPEGLVIS
jgi:two-component system cell cycle sensor histidine kinase/response regulator CckA